MLEILGVNEGNEYQAALHLRDQILKVWPDLPSSQKDQLTIFVGLKLYGHRIEDIDLVLVAHFETPRAFAIEFPFYPRNGDRFVPRQASVRNIALVIEVKSHDPTGVKFEGPLASVRYRRGSRYVWEPVTEKNRKQMFEFKEYLREKGINGLYVQNLLLFTSLTERDLPERPHNCLGGDASFERLLNVLGQVAGPERHGLLATISFGSDSVLRDVFSSQSSILTTIEPTPIDRRRMDLIAGRAFSVESIPESSETPIALRGRGGVGKTVFLLQIGYRTYQYHRRRSLLLTYNRALVADIRRVMALLGIPHSLDEGGIAIETVHGFLARLMRAFGIIGETTEDFIDEYSRHKQTLLEYLNAGALGHRDLEQLKTEQADEFCWDSLLIDEGQDWPGDEISILRYVYPEENTIIADGVDQLVRGAVADWSSGSNREELHARPMTVCLRMKANLTRFVIDMAHELGLGEWDLIPNQQAPGGRIIVIDGNIADSIDIYEEVRDDAAQLGNFPIDLLACVPPSLVASSGDKRRSAPGAALQRCGLSAWDASAIDVRKHFPTDRQDLRIVQYDSCRGLEGWSVINYSLDEFWEYKYQQWWSTEGEKSEYYGSADEVARTFASRWVMIPLTRAIDTLVINVSGSSSMMRDVLSTLRDRHSDFIEWRDAAS